jgi:predicted nuclease of predicted toxin-antitoxin system
LAPNVVLLRRKDKSAKTTAAVILENLDQIREDLERGALVVITDTRIRIRSLPVKP